MVYEIRFDNDPDEITTTSFKGDVGNYYAEELVTGPRPSIKFKRLEADVDVSEVSVANITNAEAGQSIRFGAKGVEVEEKEFDGRAEAALYRISFDYNTENGYEFNGLVDGTIYRTAQNPETWAGMNFVEVFEDIIEKQAPNANFAFDSSEWAAAADGQDQYAGSFSFRNAPLTSVIDQIVKKQGNILWWVEWNGTKWGLKFKKRDLGQTDPTFALDNGAAANIIGVDIQGPATEVSITAKILDQGKGHKVQVGGPTWIDGNKAPPSAVWISGGSTAPPLRTQLPVTGSLIDRDNIQGACAEAAWAAGIAPIAQVQAVVYKALGWSSQEASIKDLTGDQQLSGFDKPRKGFHTIPKSNLQVEDVTIEVSFPLASRSFTTRWSEGITVPGTVPGLNTTAPVPPKQPDQETALDSGPSWKLDSNLLSHPSQSFTVEVARSRAPFVHKYNYYSDISQPSQLDAYNERKTSLELFANTNKGKQHETSIIANAYVAEYSNGNQRALAVVYFFALEYRGIESAKIDSANAKVIFRTVDFAQYGDWSAVGRNDSAPVTSPPSVVTWVTDGNKYTGASSEKPLVSLWIPVSDAFKTFESSGSSSWGQHFALHGVLTAPVAAALDPGGGPKPFFVEQGDYEVHNIIFNGAREIGYPEPEQTPRDDTERMKQRAGVVLAQQDPKRNLKGRYTIFPGDKDNIKLGVFTNGGTIVKVRHDYVPYFRTQFYLEGAPEIDQLEEVPTRAEIGELFSIVQIGDEKIKKAEKAIADAGNVLGSPDKGESIKAIPGQTGHDLGSIDAGLQIKDSNESLEDTTFDNSPDLTARGFGEKAVVSLMYALGVDRFFSDGAVIDDCPTAGDLTRPGNMSSAIIKITDKANPVSGGQKLGFTHNYLDLVQTDSSGGVDDGPRYRAALNVTETGLSVFDLNSLGGDRLSVRDAYLDGNANALERNGELNSYITNDHYFTTRISGTNTAINSCHFGLSRENTIGANATFNDGAILGIGKEVGATLNYTFVCDLHLDQQTTANFATAFTNAEPQFLGIYFGPDLTNPDNATGRNNQFRIRTWEAAATNDVLTFDIITVATGGVNVRHEVKADLGDMMTFQLAVTGDSFIGQAGAAYKPVFEVEWVVLPNSRTASIRHSLKQPGNSPNKLPEFRVSHGDSAVTTDIYFMLTEQAFTGTGGGGTFQAMPSEETARFEVRAGGLMQVMGDDTNQLFIYVDKADQGFGFHQFIDSTTPAADKTFRVKTDGQWRRVGTNLVGTGSDIELHDSNGRIIDTVSLTSGTNWPNNQVVDFLIPLLEPRDPAGTGQSARCWAKEIVHGEAQWKLLGINSGLPGAQNTFLTSPYTYINRVLSGNVSVEVPAAGYSTVTSLKEGLDAYADAHNELVVKLYKFEESLATIAGAIWGADPYDPTANPVIPSENFNRNLNFKLGNAGTGQQLTEWTLLANDDGLKFGRKGGAPGVTSFHGLSIEQGSGTVGLTSSESAGEQQAHLFLKGGPSISSEWKISSEGSGDNYGLSGGSGSPPRGHNALGVTSDTKRIPFHFTLESASGTHPVTFKWFDVDGTGTSNLIDQATVLIPFGISLYQGGGYYYPGNGGGAWTGGGSRGPITGPRGRARGGRPGPAGMPGSIGPIGPKGPKGDKGDKGDKGTKGDTGSKGKTGSAGKTGSQGQTGTAGGLNSLGEPCCVKGTPGDPLLQNAIGNKFIVRDSLGNEETLFLADFIGSYDLDEFNGVAATPNADRTFEDITNLNIITADGVTPNMVDVRGDEARGVLEGQQDPLSDELQEIYDDIIPEDEKEEDAKPGELQDGTTTTDSTIDTPDSEVGLILAKTPARLDPTFSLPGAKPTITRTNPRIALSAVSWAIRFGGGGGVPNAALNAVTGQASFPIIDPRSNSHNNDTFIRSSLRMGQYAPDILIDAAGRYIIGAGLYTMPTAFDTNGNIQINTDETARVAYGGLHGILFGLLKETLGLEMRPDKIVSRRAYGVKGTVTGVTGAGGGTTDYDVILNNCGVHGAQFGDDGEFPDAYFYDKNIVPGSIVWGGDVGTARTQINRFDGLVATGNSGLWIGGLNYAVEGDSIEEAITKSDTQLFKASKSYTVDFTPGNPLVDATATETITHNLVTTHPMVTVVDKVTGEVLDVGVTHTSTSAVDIEYTASTGNDWTVTVRSNV